MAFRDILDSEFKNNFVENETRWGQFKIVGGIALAVAAPLAWGGLMIYGITHGTDSQAPPTPSTVEVPVTRLILPDVVIVHEG